MKAVQVFIFLLCALPVTADSFSEKYTKVLKNLTEATSIQVETFVENAAPFLFVATAVKVDQECSKISESIKEQILKREVSSAALTAVDTAFFSKFVSDDEVKLIQACTQESCFIKLHVATEFAPLVRGKKIKLNVDKLIRLRSQEFLQKRVLKGYDDRESNQETLIKAFALLDHLKSNFPETFQYLNKDFWTISSLLLKKTKRIYAENFIDISSAKTTKVYQLSEFTHLVENNQKQIWFELPIYSNHYFDSSFRWIELHTLGTDKCIVVVNDMLEIDELKKSVWIRLLFQGEMEKGVKKMQKDFLKDLGAIKST